MKMSSAAPKISVIIPTYNRAAFLKEAIESVLGQTYRDFELFVVDDGSTDDTSSLVCAIFDPRVRYSYQDNAGRCQARNFALSQAQGQYIAFLDDDDIFLPQKLERQVTFLENHPNVDFVASGTEVIDSQGARIGQLRSWLEQPDLTLTNCLYTCPLYTCTVLIRRAALDRLDHWFDPQMAAHDDTDLFLRLLAVGCRAEWLPEFVSAYRQHSQSSQRDMSRHRENYLQAIDKLYNQGIVSSHLLDMRSSVYAHHHLQHACHEYAWGDVTHAQQCLATALGADSLLLEGEPPSAVEKIVGFSNGHLVQDPERFIAVVLGNLPPEAGALSKYRRYALSCVHMRRVFEAHALGQRVAFRDWAKGVLNNPTWLTNRGVWSILKQDGVALI